MPTDNLAHVHAPNHLGHAAQVERYGTVCEPRHAAGRAVGAVRSLGLAALVALACTGCASTVILYSRHDAEKARHAFAMARALGPAYIDLSVRPGAEWRPAMASAICGGGTVLVLWSARAASSAEVAGELETARGCGAAVVPVLLDSTALPAGLAGVQGVDWR